MADSSLSECCGAYPTCVAAGDPALWCEDCPRRGQPSLIEFRKWNLVKVVWPQVGKYLDDGWEPFTVVQREPNTPSTTTSEIVYLRRERSAS